MSQQVNRNGKCCFMQSRIIVHHQFQAKFIATFFKQGHTDQAPPMFAHKIDHFRGNVAGSSNKIAFIFTVLIIHHYNHFTILYILNCSFNTVQHKSYFLQK